MPPPVEGLRVDVPALCFCGYKSTNGSLYCSPDCAREDAFNSLILGKPHEGSNTPAPLPTLPPGFFDFPPRRGDLHLSMDEPDEFFDPTFITAVDHGPFQSKTRSSANRNIQNKPILRSNPSSSSSSATRHRTKALPTSTQKPKSKWRSHYQRNQAPGDPSLEVPSFLVDAMTSEESSSAEAVPANRATNDGGGLLTPTPPVPGNGQGQGEKGSLPRTGSFGTIAFPTPTALTPTLAAPFDNRSSTSSSSYFGISKDGSEHHPRSSSSSYISQSTSNTGTSRTSATSFNTGPPDTSPTKSEYGLSNVESRPRYGSAFGSVEDKSVASNIVQLAIDLRESILLAKRESRRRSNTVAGTLGPEDIPQYTYDQPEKVIVQDRVEKKTSRPEENTTNPVSPSTRTTSPTKRKTGGTPISKSQWSHFAVPVSRSGSTNNLLSPVSSPQQRLSPSSPSSPLQALPGTIVKQTTVSTKARLPIGSSSLQPVKSSPKMPSNTPSSAFNVALGAKTYLAPAYAMSVPKIPTSTKTLQTSPSNHSLKAKKSEGRIRIPSMNAEDRTSLVERLKSAFEPCKKAAVEEAAKSGTGSKASQLRLKLDTIDLQREAEFLTATPKIRSEDRTPSTSGGPSTPRPSAQGNRPFWMTSPAKASPTPSQDKYLSREKRLGSEASAGSGLSYSSSNDEIAQATLCTAQRMTFLSSPLSTLHNTPLHA